MRRRRKRKKDIRVPLRPFQSSPKYIDCTHDIVFEKKWRNLHPYAARKAAKPMTIEEEIHYQNEHEGFNRIKHVDMPVFEAFLDQGIVIRDSYDQKALLDNNRFWEKEK